MSENLILDPAEEYAITQILQGEHEIPSLPEVFIELQDLFKHQDVSLRKVEFVVEKDPGLTARVLRLVNSSFYSFADRVTSLRLALVLLGTEEIYKMVLSTYLIKLFDHLPVKYIKPVKYIWLTSTTTGLIAQDIGKKNRIDDKDDLFVGGLIHDIGSLLFLNVLQVEYLKLMEYSANSSIPMSRLEVEEYGVHHGHLGGWLAREWNLPYKFQLAVRYHIDPESCSKHHTYVNLIHDAARITKQGIVEQWGDIDTPFQYIPENHLAQMNILPSIQDIPEIEHLFIKEQRRAEEFISHIRGNA